MKYFNIRWIIIVFTILLFACKKENKINNLKNVNRVNASLKDTEYKVQQLDILEITPTLKETMPDSGPYTYRWILYPVKVTLADLNNPLKPKFTELSTDKDLKKEITVSPGYYYLQYTITDVKTGVQTLNRYELTVVSAFYEGWLVMGNKNGNAQLSFIREDDKIYYDPINDVNKMKLDGKGLAAYSGIISQLREIYAFTDRNAYSFNADDFILKKTTSSLFGKDMTFSNPFYSVSYINTDQYIMSNGEVYATIAPNFGLPGKYSENFGKADFKLFPYYFFGRKFYVVFYDNKNKRFLQTDFNSRTLSTFANFHQANYDVNNVGKTMVAADIGNNREFYAVMKDNTDYFLYSILPNLASPSGIHQPMLNCPEIDQATSFACPTTLKQLYYAANNTVYVYDILANSARVVYQFPTNTKIKDIKMLKAKEWANEDNPMFNKRLVVATYNGTEGEVYYLDLTPTGDILNNTFSKKFGGFGNIVQIDYRNIDE